MMRATEEMALGKRSNSSSTGPLKGRLCLVGAATCIAAVAEDPAAAWLYRSTVAPCGSVAACRRNMSVVVDTCRNPPTLNQSWSLQPTLIANASTLTLRSALTHPEGPLCVGIRGESPDIPSLPGVALLPCSSGAATALHQDSVHGYFSSPSTKGCALDANVYRPDSAGANVCCAPLSGGSNQHWTPRGSAWRTSCAGQELCLTAQVTAPPATPPPPPPPAPAPGPPASVSTLFKPHDADVEGVCLKGMQQLSPHYVRGCPCWRIPSLVVMNNAKLHREEVIIFAEGRWFLGDGCEPSPTPPATKEDRRAIFSRRSTDGGLTFGPIHHVVGNLSDTGTAANPTAVFIPPRNELLLHFDCGGGHKGPVCGDSAFGRTFQLRSTDFGVSWRDVEPLKDFLGVWDGVAPGPGAGLLLDHPSYAGRLFMAGHHDVPTELDVAWFSDDNGTSWKLSNTSAVQPDRSAAALEPVAWPERNEFLGFDEPQFTELRNGSVLMSLRRDAHGTRGQALSSDGGATFAWSTPTIPNHAGGVQQPLTTLANGTLAYAAPNAKGRSNMTVFTSADDANSWTAAQNVYSGPSAYSALGEKSSGELLLAYERDVAGCSGESCSIELALL